MKNHLFFTLLILGLPILGHTQATTILVNEPFAPEGHAAYLVDSLSTDTLWQVGHPQKPLFDEAYSAPLAIVTDTANPYPPNTLARFCVNIVPPDSLAWYFGSFNWFGPCTDLIIKFKHRIHCDSLTEGGWVELSSDSGVTFDNIVFTSLSTQFSEGGNFYEPTPAIQDSIPGFTGSTNGWLESTFTIYGFLPLKALNNYYVLRFNFLSDADSTGKDGWMIDDIEVKVFDTAFPGACSGIEEYDPARYMLFPVPTDGWVNTYFPAGTELGFYSAAGKMLLKHTTQAENEPVDVSAWAAGIYFLQVTLPDGQKLVRKIIRR